MKTKLHGYKKNHSNWLSTWTDGILTGLWVLESSTVLLEIWGLPVFVLCVMRMQITFSPISWVLQHENKILLHNLFQPIVNVCTGQQLVRTTKSFVYVKPSKRLIWGMSNSYYSHVAKLLPNDFHMHCWSNQRLWPYVQAWSVHTAFFRYYLELKFWVGHLW